jgi:tetratricopeptide (TPR) repeat protein
MANEAEKILHATARFLRCDCANEDESQRALSWTSSTFSWRPSRSPTRLSGRRFWTASARATRPSVNTWPRAGKWDLALPLFDDTVKLRKAKLGPEHPDTVKSVSTLAACYSDADRFAEAAALWKVVLPESRKSIPFGIPPLDMQLAMAGQAFLKVHAYAEAESVLRESLAIRQKKQPNRWNTFNAQSMLGGALLGQKKYADAEPLLLKGYRGMQEREKTIPSPLLNRFTEAIERLVQLYEALDRKDIAAKWWAERAKYPAATPKDSK